MILSQFEEAVWHRRGSDCDIAEAWHDGGEIVSAIKAVLEFGEVAGYMLVADGAAWVRILVVGEIVADDAHPGSVFVEAADAFTERKARNSRSTKTS
jgi:hypothetical protein